MDTTTALSAPATGAVESQKSFQDYVPTFSAWYDASLPIWRLLNALICMFGWMPYINHPTESLRVVLTTVICVGLYLGRSKVAELGIIAAFLGYSGALTSALLYAHPVVSPTVFVLLWAAAVIPHTVDND